MKHQRPSVVRVRIPSGRLRAARGFTIVELLVSMLIMMVVMVAVYGIWFGLQRSYAFTDEDLSAQEQARNALGEVVALIRTARQPDPLPSDAYYRTVIVQAGPNSLICWTDVDRDAYHVLELTRFRVDPVSRSLYRDADMSHTGTINDTWTSTRLVGKWLSNDAGDPLFSYEGINGTTVDWATDPDTGEYLLDSVTGEKYVADPTAIRTVNIRMLVDVIKDKAPIRHELDSTVQPRNLRQ